MIYIKVKKLVSKKGLLALASIFIFTSSCKKADTVNPKVISENVKTEEPKLEKVNIDLLNKYINYESALEACSMLAKNGIKKEPNVPVMSKVEFKQMVDNFLTNERNALRLNYYRKNNLNSTSNHAARPLPIGMEIIIDNSQGVSCSGSMKTKTSLETILFTAQMNGTTISNPDFGFGGLTGEWKPVGTISQKVFDGVTTYQQYFSVSASAPWGGVNYTELYLVYGNVYHGTCTVQGMQIITTK